MLQMPAKSFLQIPTLVLLCLAIAGCNGRRATYTNNSSVRPLMVYCAAGIRLPVEAAAKAYEAEYGRKIQIDYGSSGELEGRLEIDRDAGKSRCDLYIPADESFADRARQKGLTKEKIVLAKFRLVLGINPEVHKKQEDLTTVDALLESGVRFTVCDTKAGVGKKTMTTLARANKWERVDNKKKAMFPRVTEAASAIQTSSDVDAGFIWDTTAQQFGLDAIVLDEIQNAVSQITVNVVETTDAPTDALRFARYLAAKDRGQTSFPKFGFEPTGTDTWSELPELILYCGGVNRNAIDETLREFEKREGIFVKEQYGGCGTLIAGIYSAADGTSKKAMPDAFMTCDASYMDKVDAHFQNPIDVSSTGIVMLVRKGNPKSLKSIKDLSAPGIAIGTTNPKMSTLGNLSWQLFETEDVKEQLEANGAVSVMTPTAHELIMQMTGHDKLDVALVYEANCQNVGDAFEIVRLSNEEAVAVQNIAPSRTTPYPALAERLIVAIQSKTSKVRFEQQGFQWRVNATRP